MLRGNVRVPIVDVIPSVDLLESLEHQIHILRVVEVRIACQPLKSVHLGIERLVLASYSDELVVHVLINEFLNDCREVFYVKCEDLDF